MIEARIHITVIRALEAVFTGDTLDEVVAHATMEARNNGEIQDIRVQVLKVIKTDQSGKAVKPEEFIATPIQNPKNYGG